MNPLLNVQQIKELLEKEGYCYLKYVRTQEGYKFANAEQIFTCPNHNKMIGQDEKPLSAGYLKIKKGNVIAEDWSSTLNCGPLPDDQDNVKQLLFP